MKLDSLQGGGGSNSSTNGLVEEEEKNIDGGLFARAKAFVVEKLSKIENDAGIDLSQFVYDPNSDEHSGYSERSIPAGPWDEDAEDEELKEQRRLKSRRDASEASAYGLMRSAGNAKGSDIPGSSEKSTAKSVTAANNSTLVRKTKPQPMVASHITLNSKSDENDASAMAPNALASTMLHPSASGGYPVSALKSTTSVGLGSRPTTSNAGAREVKFSLNLDSLDNDETNMDKILVDSENRASVAGKMLQQGKAGAWNRKPLEWDKGVSGVTRRGPSLQITRGSLVCLFRDLIRFFSSLVRNVYFKLGNP